MTNLNIASIRLFIFLVFFSKLSYSQNFSVSDQHHYGTSSSEDTPQMIKCHDNGFLILSYSNGSDHDKTQGNFGGNDIWVIRLNSDKSIRWEKSFGGTSQEYGNSIAELQDGTILITGSSASGINGNKTSINFGQDDYWVLKLNASGNKIWEKTFGSVDYDSPSNLFELSATRYLIIGTSSGGGISGSKTTGSYGGQDIWVIEIDSAGNEIWQESYGGNSYEFVLNALKLQNGHILIGSSSLSGISGNKNSVNFGYEDVWLIEIDPSNGQLLNEKNLGGNGTDYVYDLEEIGGSIWIAGNSHSGISGNKQSILHGSADAWLLKLDQNLSVLSDQSFGGTISCGFSGILSTSSGMIVYGYARNDANPWVSGTVKGIYDGWFVGFDTSGNYQWNYLFGSEFGGTEYIRDLIENSPNHYTFSFVSNSPGNEGDLTVPNYGASDIFLMDLDADLAVENHSFNKFSIYPNPVIFDFSITGLSENSLYEVSDVNGKLIQSGIYQTKINIQELEPGFYNLKTISESQIHVHRIIKQ